MGGAWKTRRCLSSCALWRGKQRAAIARAVIAKPQLLLADEPTGNVDAAIGRRLLKLFVELNRIGTTVVLATHDNALMEHYGAPRLSLDSGNLRVIKGRKQ